MPAWKKNFVNAIKAWMKVIELQKDFKMNGHLWGKWDFRITKLQRTAQIRQKLLEARSKMPDTAGEELFELFEMKDNKEALEIADDIETLRTFQGMESLDA